MISLGLRLMRTRSAAPRVAPLPKRGMCPACGRESFFLVAENGKLMERMADWPYDAEVLAALATRENYLCVWCGRNFRMRQLAAIAHPFIEGADVYEPAAFGVFSRGQRKMAQSYTVSEYVDEGRPGASIRGLRHEDITALTFKDNTFDLVITSELFEHVDDPWQGFAEIRRVLRVGGHHVFTVPNLPGRPTRSRTGLRAVYHVDPIRAEGIAVKTDFGDDLAERLAHVGFQTRVYEFPTPDPVARVFDSQAT